MKNLVGGDASLGQPGAAVLAPTHARYWVMAFAGSLAVITYVDRVCISQATPLMCRDLGLSKADMSLVFSAFFWAYALFEIPGGWMGDRWGARKVLMRIVLWWSFFTAATGWVWAFWPLILSRAMFGAGEAGCFPNLTKTFTVWLRPPERARAQGIMWLGARWGGALTPPLVALLIALFSWRRTFELFGAVGIVWAIVFYWWYRDNPRDGRGVNAAELALLPKTADSTLGHGRVPWRKLVTSRSVWLLWVQYACLGYPWVFYITWLPTWLKENPDLGPQEAAMLAGVPLFFGGLGSLFCGWVSPYVDRWAGGVCKGRRWLACTGFCGAAVCLVLATMTRNPYLAMSALGIASFSNDLVMPPSWGACMDVGGKLCGTLSGSMNMMTNLAQGFAAIVTALLLEYAGFGTAMFHLAAVYLLGALCWLFLDSVTPLEPADAS
jgi:ACS family glucarate transporter-like MFS transporter